MFQKVEKDHEFIAIAIIYNRIDRMILVFSERDISTCSQFLIGLHFFTNSKLKLQSSHFLDPSLIISFELNLSLRKIFFKNKTCDVKPLLKARLMNKI